MHLHERKLVCNSSNDVITKTLAVRKFMKTRFFVMYIAILLRIPYGIPQILHIRKIKFGVVYTLIHC